MFVLRGRVEEEAEVIGFGPTQKDGDDNSIDVGDWESAFHPEGSGFERRKLFADLTEGAVLR